MPCTGESQLKPETVETKPETKVVANSDNDDHVFKSAPQLAEF